MNARFADTFLFLAAMNAKDAAHGRALAILTSPEFRIVTSTWVWAEVANAMSAPASRARVASLWDRLRADSRFEMVGVSDALLARAMGLYRERTDKSWSLTDCVSFILMMDHGISEALTGDHHFTQAGFVALLA